MSHYFDANATTPLCPEARAAWLEATDQHWHNPSSPSRASARVHVLLENARAELAALFGATAESVVFNSGATEGNRDVLAYWRRISPESRVIVSAIEHPSVLENARANCVGGQLVILPVEKSGCVSMKSLVELLEKRGGGLVSLMAANNETGVIQPWQEAIEVCRQYRATLHIDATQWVGKEALEGLASADFVTACGHKFGGPKGTGFLLVSSGLSGFCGQRGGAQENDHRAGTENYPSIASMVAALQASEAQRVGVQADNGDARDRFEALLSKAISDLKIWGAGEARLSNTSSLCLPVGENTRWVRRLDQRGFLVSTGSACATGKDGPSHVLAAMGVTAEEARRTIRISALPSTNWEAWNSLAAALVELLPGMDGGDGNPLVIKL
ncbi:cysteine desulfurase family protein [Cerasicoccus arenae]|uniref:Cysteine desulfurase n=1 Tax=Cerasicoccus arenae TaxID=424488 RepID=A0A8J3DBU9_9BACT|nr:aminotransferase class V-fold PLP-dependent enzyme [Cerasicoccus arenae]MBK1857287.1 aminotransferase class V-fold PLP-dependent enzyme [Cerasicoccus arenae]GHC00475.1 cysteine desulfurase [Cerasicoccus arenae]